MPASHRTAEHHASAATHHEQAARYHREASRHFEVGKDFSHAAHQSIVAHGHTLEAVKRGNDARAYYAEQIGIPMSAEYPQIVVEKAKESLAILGVPMMDVGSSKHHKTAAGYHVEAARCHHEASKYCVQKDYKRAAYEADLACGHGQNALMRSTMASKRRIELGSKSELREAAE